MAGGTFDKLVGKVRPGTYVNFQSGVQNVVGISERGTVIVPIENNYGPAGTFISLSAASPDAERAKLGYSVYDADEGRQMLLIREAFKRASTVLVYILTEGTKAKATIGTMTATAKYGGSRGNALAVTVAENPVDGYDVTVHLDGSKVAEYEGLSTVEDLIAQDCEYITFTGTGNLTEAAGTPLTGGDDAEVENTDVTTFIDAWEKVKFNTVCFPFTDSSLQAAAKTKVTYMRENMGKGIQVVMPDVTSDYEGIIGVANAVEVDGDPLTHAEACAWVAAASAAASYTQSLTYVEYDGATAVVDPMTHEEAVDAINKGQFFFSVSEAGTVVVEYDINTLTSFVDGKDKSYGKNRVIRVFDSFNESLQINFPPNKYDNNTTGWEIMEGIGRTILRQFEDAGAIDEVDYDNDFLVDRELSWGDETFFNVGIKPVDSAEKLYFTVTTR